MDKYNKYKSKNVSLRTSTHSLLSNLSEVLVPGYTLSIPNTIDLIVKEKLSSSKDTTTEGTTDDTKKIQKT